MLSLSRQRRPSPRIRTLTTISEQSVANGSLELEGLHQLAGAGAEVVNLPRLHAKVYVADGQMAVVTSANLTTAGLDGNYEYGIAVDSAPLVSQVLADMESYAKLGNRLAPAEIERLMVLGGDLRAAWKQAVRAREGPITRKLQQLLRRMRRPVLEAQVGHRTANALFSEALLYVLRDGPLTTRQMYPRIRQLLPDLCDDAVELVIHGQRFGKRWWRAARNAQQSLKRTGRIRLEGKAWTLVSP